MNRFERVIYRSEVWLDLLDHERDTAMRAKPSQPNEPWQTWVDRLEAERRDVVELIAELRRLQHRRPLLFDTRPANLRMLKMPAYRRQKRKGA